MRTQTGDSSDLPRREQARLESIKQFVRSLMPEREAWEGENRRDSERHPYIESAEMVPLAPDWEPAPDLALPVVTRNLSNAGIAVACRRAWHEPEAAIRLHAADGSSILVRVRIAWSRPIGRNLYEVGAEFLGRLD